MISQLEALSVTCFTKTKKVKFLANLILSIHLKVFTLMVKSQKNVIMILQYLIKFLKKYHQNSLKKIRENSIYQITSKIKCDATKKEKTKNLFKN